MTPKEKALKLRFHYSIILNLLTTDLLVLNSCLKAINEILNSVQNENVSDNFYKYWEQVKIEIEKL